MAELTSYNLNLDPTHYGTEQLYTPGTGNSPLTDYWGQQGTGTTAVFFPASDGSIPNGVTIVRDPSTAGSISGIIDLEWEGIFIIHPLSDQRTTPLTQAEFDSGSVTVQGFTYSWDPDGATLEGLDGLYPIRRESTVPTFISGSYSPTLQSEPSSATNDFWGFK